MKHITDFDRAEVRKAEADARVAAGVQFLNEHEPDWRNRIVLKDLNLMNTCDCVLGMVYGNGEDPGFLIAVDCPLRAEMGVSGTPVINSLQATQFGFDIGAGLNYSDLQWAWERELS